jgi:hypothetical protein
VVEGRSSQQRVQKTNFSLPQNSRREQFTVSLTFAADRTAMAGEELMEMASSSSMPSFQKGFKRRIPKPLRLPVESPPETETREESLPRDVEQEINDLCSEMGDESLVDDNCGTTTEANCVDEKEHFPHDDKRRRIVISSPIEGDRVSVFFPKDKVWEDGEVIGCNGIQHLIWWDHDHEKEWLDLSAYQWKKSSKSAREKKLEDAAKRKKVESLKVGSKISVFWPKEKKFFLGKVERINFGKKKPHYILYDDGDKEHTDLFFRSFKTEDGRFDNLKPGSKICIWNVNCAQFLEATVVRINPTETYPHLIQYGKFSTSQEWVNLMDHEFYQRGIVEVKPKKEVTEEPACSSTRMYAGRGRAVEQLDPIEGTIIAKFESVADAARSIGGRRSCIRNVCTGRQKISYGFLWRYKDHKLKDKSRKAKKVQQVCPNTCQVLATFDSITDAAKATGAAPSSISKCCNGGRVHSSAGFSWQFVDNDSAETLFNSSVVKTESKRSKQPEKSCRKDSGKKCDRLWEFHGIIGHTGPFTRKNKAQWRGCPYNVVIDWKGNYKPTEEPLDGFYDQHPDVVYEYAKDNGLLDDPGWNKCVSWNATNNDIDLAMEKEDAMQGSPLAKESHCQT